MKTRYICVLVLFGVILVSCAPSSLVPTSTIAPTQIEKFNASKEDLDAIRQTTLDYMEGWYYADAERMKQSIHPELIKRTINDNKLITVGAEEMVKYTQAGAGRRYQGEKEFNVTILDVYHDIASVVGESPEYIDYLQIGKVNGGWVIINALWTQKSGQ
jgi:hypothetical protein